MLKGADSKIESGLVLETTASGPQPYGPPYGDVDGKVTVAVCKTASFRTTGIVPRLATK